MNTVIIAPHTPDNVPKIRYIALPFSNNDFSPEKNDDTALDGKAIKTAVKNNGVKRLGALLSVKSLVTLLLSGVFAYLAITGQTSQEFMTVYTVVIAFYFGTQTQKISDAVEKTTKEG